MLIKSNHILPLFFAFFLDARTIPLPQPDPAVGWTTDEVTNESEKIAKWQCEACACPDGTTAPPTLPVNRKRMTSDNDTASNRRLQLQEKHPKTILHVAMHQTMQACRQLVQQWHRYELSYAKRSFQLQITRITCRAFRRFSENVGDEISSG